MMTSEKRFWSELLPELVIEIAKKIKLMEDFDAFREVCHSWRAAVVEKDFTRTIPNVPLLMLAEEEDSDEREFFSLCKDKICKRMRLPEAKGKKLMESRGWFITADKRGDMSLLHPFSHVQIPLPNQNTIPEAEDYLASTEYIILERAVLSANPFEASDYIVLVAHVASFGLAFLRPGQKTWTGLTGVLPQERFDDVNYLDGRFYALEHKGQVWALEISGGSDSTRVQTSMVLDVSSCDHFLASRKGYLVQVSGKLLFITRNGTESDVDEEGNTEFHIFELDLIKGNWREIKSLEDMSVFVGNNSAFSVDAKAFPGIKPNCIYFTDDAVYWVNIEGGRDMGIYHVRDRKIERFGDGQLFRVSNINLPRWIVERLGNGNSFTLINIVPPLWITPYFS